MTPEPAQPAESPEAIQVNDEHRQRARELLTTNNFALEGGYGYRLVEMLAPLFAASTARPTERGAVEAIAAIIRDYNPKPCGLGWPINAAKAILALPATDQAAEVGDE